MSDPHEYDPDDRKESKVSEQQTTGNESLLLKWGTLKGWDLKSDASMAAMRKYHEAGHVSMSAMAQRDNGAQKDALCELIDAIDGYIQNDWSGEMMTKDEAKAYVRDYGKS